MFQIPLAARGAAFGDLNNDGFVDVAINCHDGPAMVLMNQGGNGNHWLLVNTLGTRSNRDGIGANIRLVSRIGRGTARLRKYGPVATLQPAINECTSAWGRDSKVRLLEITWPSGTVQRLENVNADQVLTIKESAS